MKIFKTVIPGLKKYLALALFFTLVVLREIFDWNSAVLGIGLIAVVLVDLLVTMAGKPQPWKEVLRTKIFHLAIVIVAVFLLIKFFPV